MYDMIRKTNGHDVFASPLFRLFDEASRPVRTMVPPVDVLESDTEIRLVMEIAGLNRETLDVTLENQTLTIRGEKKPLWENREGVTYTGERTYGQFTRAFKIPSRVNAGDIQASYADGLLEVVLPKAPEAQPRRIEVK